MGNKSERPLVIRRSGRSMYRVRQGGLTLAFASSFEKAMARRDELRDMIRNGVLDVPALVS